MYKLIILFVVCWNICAWADCTFNITNYSDTPVVVAAGFYGGESAVISVEAVSNKSIKIKNNLHCNGTSNIGFGVTYVNLVTKLSEGGWVYAPSVNMIRGVGVATGSQDRVVGKAPNGEKLTLFNNASPNADSFDVRIEKANRNISRQLGSMN